MISLFDKILTSFYISNKIQLTTESVHTIMSPTNYQNLNYIIYRENYHQYTEATNDNIFNLSDSEILMSVWVFIRTYNYPICNESWDLSCIGGAATFTAYHNETKYQVVHPLKINDANWHLISWGKYLVNDEMRLFISVDNSIIIESEGFDRYITFQNDSKLKIARLYSDYSTIYADELSFVAGIKYTNAIGNDLYGQGIFYPGKPTSIWPSGHVMCYWQFNKTGTVDDMSGNGNTGIHFFNPEIAPHIP